MEGTISSIWLDLRIIPAFVCCICAFILGCAALTNIPTIKKRLSGYTSLPPVMHNASEAREDASLAEKVRDRIHSLGGSLAFGFLIAKLLGCVALVVLSAIAISLSEKSSTHGTEMPHWPSRISTHTGCMELATTIAYIYATTMLTLALTLCPLFSRICSVHATCILLVLFLVFAWRNLVPLTTCSGVPADAPIPWLLWSRGVLLTIVGMLLPLLTPRVYRPVDPSNPAAEPSPEQTASIFSFAVYMFLDSLVFVAYRKPQLSYESLPPLADYDWAKNLGARSMEQLDPICRRDRGLKPRSLLGGMLHLFRWEWLTMAALLVTEIGFRFLRPIGLYRLLEYMETDGEGAVVRPWVWVSFLLICPVVGSVIRNFYMFLSTRISVQAESMIIQLLFDHAMRIRLTDEPAATSSEQSGVSTPVNVDELVATDDSAALNNGGTAAPSGLPDTQPPKKTASDDETSRVTGKINTLIGTDLPTIVEGRDFLEVLLRVPLQITISIWFLYAILGWAAIVGLVVLVLALPIPGFVAGRLNSIQVMQMQKTDLRIQAITDVLNIIRMVKMFGWEEKVKRDIAEKRDIELQSTLKREVCNIILATITQILPLITLISVFASYTMVMKRNLTASRVFSSVVVFESLRTNLGDCFFQLSNLIKAKVSLNRVDEFLAKTELLDMYRSTSEDDAVYHSNDGDGEIIGFHNATFTWTDTADKSVAVGRRNFVFHLDDVIFKPGVINLIVGPTASGKTSLLMALLGEMHFQANGVDSWFTLPRSQGVAYAAQESWLQNESIKGNILFGEQYDDERYKKVLYQCALEPDLKLFDVGDETEVGEKGITLSGGQKARITLARAVYSRASILLLDDVLSALDVHTSRWVVNKCLKGDLIECRTVLLVTHAVALTAPIAANIVSVGHDGRVLSQGPVSHALSTDALLREEMQKSAEFIKMAEGTEKETRVPEEQSDGKLVVVEETAEGRLRWSAVKLLIGAFGGPLFWTYHIGAYSVLCLGIVAMPWWLGVWAKAYEGAPAGSVHVSYYLSVYAVIIMAQLSLQSVTYINFVCGSIRASRRIHSQLCDSVLGTTIRWLDSTPVGRIISRFTQDILEIDSPLSFRLLSVIAMTLSLTTHFTVIVIISPIYLLPSVLIAILGIFLGRIYVLGQMPVKRQMSISRSPLYNHFDAAISGLISIRAYGAKEAFKDKLLKRLDGHARPARTFYNLNQWISIRIDALGGFFATGLAIYLVYFARRVGASNTGFSLSLAVEFSTMILWWVQSVNGFEISGNSLERVADYLVIEQEPKSTEAGKPPAYWPASGSIVVEHLCARYSASGPIVLDDLSFEIKSGERIGIVGRTGSGKSSLALSLLRMILTTGEVYFDERPIHEINLDSLRANLTIIPQEPKLISGTIRSNLDPFTQHDDAVLNDALHAAGLYRHQLYAVEGSITLDTSVSGGGNNFSVGERQLLALARAIVRGTKVLILDEATASVDEETDDAIQMSIRTHLKHATLLTIAHRLQTIADYDKIMVLDAGKMVEFDSPLTLLQREDSLFRRLVDESGDKDKLWDAARKAGTNFH